MGRQGRWTSSVLGSKAQSSQEALFRYGAELPIKLLWCGFLQNHIKFFLKSELDTKTRKRTRATVDIFCQEYIHHLGFAGVYKTPTGLPALLPGDGEQDLPSRPVDFWLLCFLLRILSFRYFNHLITAWFPDPTQIINDSDLVLCLPPL